MSEESRGNIWDDGLHFTPNGYDVMGDHIGKKLVELVQPAAVRENRTRQAKGKRLRIESRKTASFVRMAS
jgi:hypothetical protein